MHVSYIDDVTYNIISREKRHILISCLKSYSRASFLLLINVPFTPIALFLSRESTYTNTTMPKLVHARHVKIKDVIINH